MEKINIEIADLLPNIPNSEDSCVHRFIQTLQQLPGVEKVHRSTLNDKDIFCFHFNPSITTKKAIETQAKNEGLRLHKKYGHLLLEVKGVRHARHARLLEEKLKKLSGVTAANVSSTGFISIEYNKEFTNYTDVIAGIKNTSVQILSSQNLANPLTAADHDSDDHTTCDHDHHHHHNFLGEKTELLFAILSGIFLAAGFMASFYFSSFVAVALYGVAYLFGGYFTAIESFQGIKNKQFEIDFLMLIAAVGAAFIGHWGEGALLLFLFSLGHSLEHFAMNKAKRSIKALSGITPKSALLKKGDNIVETPIAQLVPGNIIIVRPDTRIAADGIVVSGNSTVNQAPITGESIPVEKKPYTKPLKTGNDEFIDASHKVFAGTINGNETLEIFVTKIAADSTISRLVKLVNEAQTQKSATQNFTVKVERYYVPIVLLTVVLLLFAFLVKDEPFSKSLYRAITVLVAASPCALAISTPSAVLSGVARAARGGVLIKGGKPLEALGSINALAFDKTGTLTEGKPKLMHIEALNGFNEARLQQIVLAVEKLSDHPIARSVVNTLELKGITAEQHAGNARAIAGKGMTAVFEDSAIFIGNIALLKENNVVVTDDLVTKVEALEQQGNTVMLIAVNDVAVGLMGVMDIARDEAAATIIRLRKIGIEHFVMLTGDNQRVANSIAAEIGIPTALAGLLPEQKLNAIKELEGKGYRIAMVGDGVNDAPAMARSRVGIVMGAAGSDVALETADVALMADKLSGLPFAIGLAKKAKSIIRQNLIISIGMVFILVPLTMLDIAHIGPAVIGHEGSTLIVVFNALRLLIYRKE